ncbi:uncharacterized protein [Eurosta solidaginis]|uniref:uncharacterized protein n=1 Tax=Eurosta solidaginis TaxID=178769 RepID=UPI0035312DD3
MLEKTKHFVIGRPQKNYRVVFIKEPSSSAANVKLSAEYAPQEEKTVIYVLTKKDSTLKVNDIATPAPKKPSKPEVVFIKYKTEEEAHHVQQKIQAEYDKIEGTSEHTNGGIGEQQSVVGILGSGADGADGHFDGLNGVVNGGSSNGSSSSSGVGSSSYSSSGSSGIGESFGSGVIGSSSTNTVKSHIYLPPSN